MDEDGFILVRARKKRTRNLVCFNKCDTVTSKDSQQATKDNCDSVVDTKQFYEEIKQSEIEFFQSDFFHP